MEYHQDRFEDYSLMVYKQGKLVALFPANIIGDEVYSHKGLSYGGFLVKESIRVEGYIEAFKALLTFLESEKINNLYIKQMPAIYNKKLNGEFDYLLAKLDAETMASDSYFVIDDLVSYKPNRNRNRSLLLAEKEKVTISSEGIELFWEDILTKNLYERFKASPVHTIQEIKSLMSRFPNHIKFLSAKKGNQILAGVVIFITDKVTHFQYSSGGEDRNETGALDLLFHTIIEEYKHKEFISFGSASVDGTLKISKGLAYWKESFGAHLMPQMSFKINPVNHDKLNDIFK